MRKIFQFVAVGAFSIVVIGDLFFNRTLFPLISMDEAFAKPISRILGIGTGLYIVHRARIF